MEGSKLKELIKDIVKQAKDLKDDYTDEKGAVVNYSAVFSHSKEEYDALIGAANRIGRVIDDTPTGPIFLIEPLDTIAGKLRLAKIRKPDETRKERGDADFTVPKYETFKKDCLSKPGFKLIVREKFEMVELKKDGFNVLAYFSNPPQDKLLGI